MEREVLEQLDAYFTGEVDADGIERLARWLAADPDHYRLFVEATHIETAINQIYKARRLEQMFEAFTLDELLQDAEQHQTDPVDITDSLDRARHSLRFRQNTGQPVSRSAPGPRMPRRTIIIPKLVAYGFMAAAVLVVAAIVWPLLTDADAPRQAADTEIEGPIEPEILPDLPVQIATVVDQSTTGAGDLMLGHQLWSGDVFAIETGMAKLTTPQGAVLILEAPAQILAIKRDLIRIDYGAVVVRCEAEGSQITVDAGDVQVTDLGTEFAIERHGVNSLSIHVFNGEVIARRTGGLGTQHDSQELFVERGEAISYIHETGFTDLKGADWSGFVRDFSSAPYTAPDYVMAYWRFEDRPDGEYYPHGLAVRDTSGNGNHMYTGPAELATRHGTEAAERSIPHTYRPNTGILDDTDSAEHGIRNLYTRDLLSHARRPLLSEPFIEWTVEFSARFSRLSDLQSVVSLTVDKYSRPLVRLGSDGDRLYAGTEDQDGNWRDVTASSVRLATDRWYHVAVTNDGRWMTILLCEQGARRYRQIARIRVNGTHIFPNRAPEGYDEWTIGGEGESHDFSGMVDEVRISNRALSPEELLFSSGKERDDQAGGGQ